MWPSNDVRILLIFFLYLWLDLQVPKPILQETPHGGSPDRRDIIADPYGRSFRKAMLHLFLSSDL